MKSWRMAVLEARALPLAARALGWFFVCSSLWLFGGGETGVADQIENGGFESVDGRGFPVGWGQVGEAVGVSHDAHSGQVALSLTRTEAACRRKLETGANLAWVPGSGQKGAMLEALKGGLHFHYKIVEGCSSSRFVMNIIPMSERGVEDTGHPRVQSFLPASHRGDGKWHEAWMAYDFSRTGGVRWVQVSARVEGPAGGAMILDDVAWIDRVGPVPSIGPVALSQAGMGRAQLRVVVGNIGDENLNGKVAIELPEGLMSHQPLMNRAVDNLAPGQLSLLTWNVVGMPGPGSIIRAGIECAGRIADRELTFTPRIAEVFFLAHRSVLWPGQESDVEVVAWNIGDALEPEVMISIQIPPGLVAVGEVPDRILEVPPNGFRSVSFRVHAVHQTKSATILCDWHTVRGEQRGAEAGRSICEMTVGGDPYQAQNAPRIVCGSTEVVFPKSEFGYGLGWIYALPEGRFAGVIPGLGRIVLAGGPPEGHPLFAKTFGEVDEVPVLGGAESAPMGHGVRFRIDVPGLQDPIVETFACPARGEGDVVTVRIEGPQFEEETLKLFEAPCILAGDGSFGKRKSEALVPGLEWLENEEMSSSNLDIEYDHPQRLRWRQHPLMVTLPLMCVRKDDLALSLYWHPRASWNDGHERPGLTPDGSDVDRPTPVFASPDRFQGHAGHRLGLVLPTVPRYLSANADVAAVGWPAKGVDAHKISLVFGFDARLGVASVLDCLQTWFNLYGLAPLRGLPDSEHDRGRQTARVDMYRGDGCPGWLRCARADGRSIEPSRAEWIAHLEWSVQGYLTSLWDPTHRGWLRFKGGPAPAREVGPFGAYQLDLKMAEMLSGQEPLRRKVIERLESIKSGGNAPLPASEDLGFYWGRPFETLLDQVEKARRIADSVPSAGGWTFSPGFDVDWHHRIRDYAKLGFEGEEAIGLTASKAVQLFRAYQLSGDRQLLQAGQRCLEYMEKFKIPRGAQVWEVVVHSPDLLAATEACEAFLEGYLATGEERWRRLAVYWAAAGIPFIYQWDVDAHPWMRYGSMPVFGSSWGTIPWFGRVVQWNGLRWAAAVLDLAPYDRSYPWRTMAAGVVISATLQQERDALADNLCLWPDAYDTISGESVNWFFSPARIHQVIYKLLGYDLRPHAVALDTPTGEIRLVSCGQIGKARFCDGRLRVEVGTPEPLSSQILVLGVSKPERVSVNGTVLPELASGAPSGSVGWKVVGCGSVVQICTGLQGKLDLALEGISPRPWSLCQAEGWAKDAPR